jgi:hypothetical protein
MRVPVLYGIEYLDRRGYTTDISLGGMGIKSNNVLPPGTELIIRLDVNGVVLTANAIVRWARRAPPQLVRYTRCGMGVEFTILSNRFREFIGKMEIRG